MNILGQQALELRRSLGRLRRAVDAFVHANERARFRLQALTPYEPPTHDAEVIPIGTDNKLPGDRG
jgi:hypothetical protein